MTKKYELLAKETSPGVFVSGSDPCGGGSCPAVIRRSDGKLIVVGKRMNKTEESALTGSGLVKLYEDEFAIIVDSELLDKAIGK